MLAVHCRITFWNCSEAGRTDEKPYHQKHKVVTLPPPHTASKNEIIVRLD
jgi:hypothetical protein